MCLTVLQMGNWWDLFLQGYQYPLRSPARILVSQHSSRSLLPMKQQRNTADHHLTLDLFREVPTFATATHSTEALPIYSNES